MKVFAEEGEVKSLEVEPSDTWNLYLTLTPVILESLKVFQATTHSYPSELKSHEEWDEILQKMIFSFQSIQEKKHDPFEWYEGEVDIQIKKRPDGWYESVKGPNHTSRFLEKEYDAHMKQVREGLALFSQYYLELWD